MLSLNLDFCFVGFAAVPPKTSFSTSSTQVVKSFQCYEHVFFRRMPAFVIRFVIWKNIKNALCFKWLFLFCHLRQCKIIENANFPKKCITFAIEINDMKRKCSKVNQNSILFSDHWTLDLLQERVVLVSVPTAEVGPKVY